MRKQSHQLVPLLRFLGTALILAVVVVPSASQAPSQSIGHNDNHKGRPYTGSQINPLPLHGTRHLPGSGVEAVEEVGGGDHEDDGRETLLVVVPGGLVPDLVGDRVRPIG